MVLTKGSARKRHNTGRKTDNTVEQMPEIDNKCIKATSIKVLEAESGAIALDIHLDQVVKRSRETRRCSEVISSVQAKIRSNLRGKRGK